MKYKTIYFILCNIQESIEIFGSPNGFDIKKVIKDRMGVSTKDLDAFLNIAENEVNSLIFHRTLSNPQAGSTKTDG